MRRSALVYSLAASSVAVDGVGVGAWLATRELDGRPRARRRVRAAVLGAVAAVGVAQAAADLVWHRSAPEDADCDDRLLPREDAVAYRRYAAVALVATALVWPIEKRAPVVLARRGVARPHLAFGVLVGTTYAAATTPVWLLQARDRLAARAAAPPTAGRVPREP